MTLTHSNPASLTSDPIEYVRDCFAGEIDVEREMNNAHRAGPTPGQIALAQATLDTLDICMGIARGGAR